jgi:hypothetical protein
MQSFQNLPELRDTWREAVLAVRRVEARVLAEKGFHDPNAIAGRLASMTPGVPAIPTLGYIRSLRIAELARACARVSDGNGGIDPSSRPIDLAGFRNVQAGRSPDGAAFSASRAQAIKHGLALP